MHLLIHSLLKTKQNKLHGGNQQDSSVDKGAYHQAFDQGSQSEW